MFDDRLYSAHIAADWSRRLKQYRRSSWWHWVVFSATALAAPVPLIYGLVPIFPSDVVVAFVLLFVAQNLWARPFFVLKCPNCGQPPRRIYGKGTVLPVLWVHNCSNCHYWFEDPSTTGMGA